MKTGSTKHPSMTQSPLKMFLILARVGAGQPTCRSSWTRVRFPRLWKVKSWRFCAKKGMNPTYLMLKHSSLLPSRQGRPTRTHLNTRYTSPFFFHVKKNTGQGNTYICLLHKSFPNKIVSFPLPGALLEDVERFSQVCAHHA